MLKKVATLVLLASCGVVSCNSQGQPESGEAPGTETSVQRLDSTSVPADLRHLIPLAERWGVGDDVERNAKVDGATSAERAELRAAVDPFQSRITSWLDSFGQTAMTNEAAAFMYMQLALEEMRAGKQ